MYTFSSSIIKTKCSITKCYFVMILSVNWISYKTMLLLGNHLAVRFVKNTFYCDNVKMQTNIPCVEILVKWKERKLSIKA